MQNAKRAATKRRIARTAKAKSVKRKTVSKKPAAAKRLTRKSKRPASKARIARRDEPAAPQKSRCLFHYTSGERFDWDSLVRLGSRKPLQLFE